METSSFSSGSAISSGPAPTLLRQTLGSSAGGSRASATPGRPPLPADAKEKIREKEEKKAAGEQRKEIKHFIQTEKKQIVREVQDLETKRFTLVEDAESNQRLILQAEEKFQRVKVKKQYKAARRELWPDDVSVSQATTTSQMNSRTDSKTPEPDPYRSDLLERTLRPTESNASSRASETKEKKKQKLREWLADAIQRERELQSQLPEDSTRDATESIQLSARSSIMDAEQSTSKISNYLTTPREPMAMKATTSPRRASPPKASVATGTDAKHTMDVSTATTRAPARDRASSPVDSLSAGEFPPAAPPAAASAAPPLPPSSSRSRSPQSAQGSPDRRAWGAVEDAIENSLVLHQTAIAFCDEELQKASRAHHDARQSNWSARVVLLIDKVREEVNYRKSLDSAPNATKKRGGRRVPPPPPCTQMTDDGTTPRTISGINADTFKALSTELRICILGLQESLRTRRGELSRVEKQLVLHGQQTLDAHEKAADLLGKYCANPSRGLSVGATPRSARGVTRSASPYSTLSGGTPQPPVYIQTMWEEEREFRELWLRKAAELSLLLRQRIDELEGPLRDLEQAFILGSAAGGSAKWKVLLDDMYHVAINGGVWVPTDSAECPFTLSEKFLRQELSQKRSSSVLWNSGVFLCLGLVIAFGIASLQYHQYNMV